MRYMLLPPYRRPGGTLVSMDEDLLWGGQHVCCCGRGCHTVRGEMPHPVTSARTHGSHLTEFSGVSQETPRAGCRSSSPLLQ